MMFLEEKLKQFILEGTLDCILSNCVETHPTRGRENVRGSQINTIHSLQTITWQIHPIVMKFH